ncbi:MAG: hypothetical protein GVY19_05460 [Bacteroidetes bacterium]|jgi:hypothetical protein|nr:hypothetical protein [Bacteroidota bacterium]
MKKLIALFALAAFFAAQPISATTVQVEKANIVVSDDEKPAKKDDKKGSKDAKSCSKEEKKSCDKPCDKKD